MALTRVVLVSTVEYGFGGRVEVRGVGIGPTANGLNILYIKLNTIASAFVANILVTHGKLTGPIKSVARCSGVHINHKRGGGCLRCNRVIPLTGLGSVIFNT